MRKSPKWYFSLQVVRTNFCTLLGVIFEKYVMYATFKSPLVTLCTRSFNIDIISILCPQCVCRNSGVLGCDSVSLDISRRFENKWRLHLEGSEASHTKERTLPVAETAGVHFAVRTEPSNVIQVNPRICRRFILSVTSRLAFPRWWLGCDVV
jgi:hypothetical protein